MKPTNDLDLLREFTRGHSQDAFTALVQRHLDLVYCAASVRTNSPRKLPNLFSPTSRETPPG